MFERFKQAWKIAKHIEAEELKEITPMTTLPSYKSNKPIWKEWSTENAVKEGFKASTWVYACVNRISKTAASVPWKVYRETSEGLEEVPNHPLELLLKKPNPYMSGQDIMERMVSHLYLGGNTLLSKVRANNIVAELWPISPDLVAPVPTNNDFIAGYEYKQDGVTRFIEASEIIHVMFVDPANLYWGTAPLQAVAKVVDTDTELVNFQKISLQNRAITDGVFSFKQPLTRQQWEEAREMIREQHMGTGNARTPWVLGAEANWQQMSLSPAEMDFINSRNFTREEIASVFAVPPPLIGLYDNATLANIETARKIFWLDTLIPLLEDLKSSFNLSLTPEFGDDIILDYDVSNVQAIQDNYDEKVGTAEKLWKMGVPFNAINQRLQLGFDEVEGGEIGYLPINIIQAGEPIPNNTSTSDNTINQNHITPSNKKSMNLQSEEEKEAYWRKFDGRREDYVTQFRKRAESLFSKESEQVTKAFRNGGSEEVFTTIEEQEKAWAQLATAMYLAIIEDFGESTWEEIQKQKSIEHKAFDPWDKLIQSWIAKSAAELITNVLDTTKDLVRNVLATAREEKLTVDQTARMIREKYEDFTPRRSEVIARTETVRASNFGSLESAKQTGLTLMKVWVSSRDSRVRDSHKDVDGTMIEMDEEFTVGGSKMRFPGDPNGEGKESINCRCVLSYRRVRNN